jgi:hypothetical protein
MMYSYILVLPAAYSVVMRLRALPAALALLAAMAISTTVYRPPVFNLLADVLPPYYPLLVAYAIWALGLYWMHQSRKTARGAGPAAANGERD